MPYLLLFIGIVLGLYALYRFFLSADVHQIGAFLFAVLTIILGSALLFLAVSGRLPAALALGGAVIPFIPHMLKFRRKMRERAKLKKLDPPEDLREDRDEDQDQD